MLSRFAAARLANPKHITIADTIAEGLKEPAVIRVGKYKLITPSGPGAGDYRIVPWPAPAPAPVAFGTTGNGSRNGYPEDTDACRAPVFSPGPTPPPGGTTCSEGCLFDLETDISESKNLYNESALAGTVESMTARLVELAASGPPWAFPCDDKTICDEITAENCAAQDKTGFIEPTRTSL
eukprot:COSAG04_NODE_5459_length_1611_cov_10.940936_2_plen_181_part_00